MRSRYLCWPSPKPGQSQPNAHHEHSKLQDVLPSIYDVSLPKPHPLPYIPKVIYQTWPTRTLPPGIRRQVQQVQEANPNFTHILFDDQDCREFIKQNFPREVLFAYDSLLPGAYKADLWRYCILFRNGGMYLDCKFAPAKGFTFETMVHQEHFCKDRAEHFLNRRGVYNAFMITKPGNPYLQKAIQRIVKNCYKRVYGHNALYPTGPGLLGQIIPAYYDYKTLKHIGDGKIQYQGNTILVAYSDATYREELGMSSKATNYDRLFRLRAVYNPLAWIGNPLPYHTSFSTSSIDGHGS